MSSDGTNYPGGTRDEARLIELTQEKSFAFHLSPQEYHYYQFDADQSAMEIHVTKGDVSVELQDEDGNTLASGDQGIRYGGLEEGRSYYIQVENEAGSWWWQDKTEYHLDITPLDFLPADDPDEAVELVLEEDREATLQPGDGSHYYQFELDEARAIDIEATGSVSLTLKDSQGEKLQEGEDFLQKDSLDAGEYKVVVEHQDSRWWWQDKTEYSLGLNTAEAGRPDEPGQDPDAARVIDIWEAVSEEGKSFQEEVPAGEDHFYKFELDVDAEVGLEATGNVSLDLLREGDEGDSLETVKEDKDSIQTELDPGEYYVRVSNETGEWWWQEDAEYELDFEVSPDGYEVSTYEELQKALEDSDDLLGPEGELIIHVQADIGGEGFESHGPLSYDLDHDLTITGDVTLDAEDHSRIFELDAPDHNITIDDLTLSGGNHEDGLPGGAIWAHVSSLDVEESVFVDNTGNIAVRGNDEVNTFMGTDGDDHFVVVGDLRGASKTNEPEHTALLGTQLTDLVGYNFDEDAGGSAQVINGAGGTNTLHVYGVADISNFELENVNFLEINSDVTADASDIEGMDFIKGDGGSTLRVVSGEAVEIDLSEFSGVSRLHVAEGVSASISSLGGVRSLSGTGTIAAREGALDLREGMVVERGLGLKDADGADSDRSGVREVDEVRDSDRDADVIEGGPGDDYLVGNTSDQLFLPGGGSNVIEGGGGQNIYRLEEGSDNTIHASPSDDILDLSLISEGVALDLREGGTGEDEAVGITVVVGGEAAGRGALDVHLSQDLSGSFGTDVATLRSHVDPDGDDPSLMEQLREVQPNTNFGLSGFIDKPLQDVFDTTLGGGGGDTPEYPFEEKLDMTSNADRFVEAVFDDELMEVRWGGDAPESQLSALQQIGLRGNPYDDTYENSIGFRAGATKVAIIATDVDFHEGPIMNETLEQEIPPNDGTTTLRRWKGDEDNPPDVIGPPGTGEDFPTRTQVKEALDGADIYPVILLQNYDWYRDDYEELLDYIGRGSIVPLAGRTDDVTAAILEAIGTIDQPAIQTVVGTQGDDQITGNRLNNVIWGYGGENTIDGGGGTNIIIGSGNADTLELPGTREDHEISWVSVEDAPIDIPQFDPDNWEVDLPPILDAEKENLGWLKIESDPVSLLPIGDLAGFDVSDLSADNIIDALSASATLIENISFEDDDEWTLTDLVEDTEGLAEAIVEGLDTQPIELVSLNHNVWDRLEVVYDIDDSIIDDVENVNLELWTYDGEQVIEVSLVSRVSEDESLEDLIRDGSFSVHDDDLGFYDEDGEWSDPHSLHGAYEVRLQLSFEDEDNLVFSVAKDNSDDSYELVNRTDEDGLELDEGGGDRAYVNVNEPKVLAFYTSIFGEFADAGHDEKPYETATVTIFDKDEEALDPDDGDSVLATFDWERDTAGNYLTVSAEELSDALGTHVDLGRYQYHLEVENSAGHGGATRVKEGEFWGLPELVWDIASSGDGDLEGQNAGLNYNLASPANTLYSNIPEDFWSNFGLEDRDSFEEILLDVGLTLASAIYQNGITHSALVHKITSGYFHDQGYYDWYVSRGYEGRYHIANDFRGAAGDEIFSPVNGDVIHTRDWTISNNNISYILIEEEDGKVWQFMHINWDEDLSVSENVSVGDPLGTISGHDGTMTPHLHLSVFLKNKMPEGALESNGFRYEGGQSSSYISDTISFNQSPLQAWYDTANFFINENGELERDLSIDSYTISELTLTTDQLSTLGITIRDPELDLEGWSDFLSLSLNNSDGDTESVDVSLQLETAMIVDDGGLDVYEWRDGGFVVSEDVNFQQGEVTDPVTRGDHYDSDNLVKLDREDVNYYLSRDDYEARLTLDFDQDVVLYTEDNTNIPEGIRIDNQSDLNALFMITRDDDHRPDQEDGVTIQDDYDEVTVDVTGVHYDDGLVMAM
ncbi:hypothetical protein Dthio_PD2996 [Desulfonatronospira thiodismutans ASO3-1]|uniref:Integrin beta subunit VWA domain-containing protein n=1 Tax=Desulfonatronospira thiodismutans ASO3-1 TaxID=555779 RepID=D6SLK9_9BACT|nr:peptidoglycan DD-metalloendopeptidase family protein [Desulfonatronospira thiodismutans]EFI35570.1 hypothetical protein Dthio_PD2996 [Desulfonatronospira thiodismutans ASO3-1]